ncbi:MAG: diguanylate cyclase [Alcaligenaceae bacterium]|nr:MAG: diguanylate cyclase [Alcaligenaceae bacterium]
MIRNSQLNTKLPLRTALFICAICAAIIGWSSWREWQSRQSDLALAEVETRNLARSVTQYADDTFHLATTLIAGVVGRLEAEGTGPEVIARLRKVLDARRASLGNVRGLFVYDEKGRWLATTEPIDMTGLNNSDRNYFAHHKNSVSSEVLIGNPVRSRSGGHWIITASRRISRFDGSFAGVALATIDVAHFHHFFSSLDLGAKGSLSLLTKDGIILSRYPDDGTYIGMDMSKSPLFASLARRPPEADYNFKSPLDGEDRLSSYKISNAYPIVALATKSSDDVLANWKREAMGRLLVILGLLCLICGFGIYLVRQLLDSQRLANALANQEAAFRLLAEESSDMVLRIGFDERIQYISPSCVSILGVAPNALIGTNSVAGVHPEDRPQVIGTIANLKSSKISEAKISYRTRRGDNSVIWLETALRSTRGASGELNGVVAISRDITSQVDMNAQLTALAQTDPLTGLANRRHFDEIFAMEWARAARDRISLAIILLDVDRFKKYNDHYGHPAGDLALKEIARVLEQHARRPADLVARYGGEEFVLLLPNTDSAGARTLAEAIRQGVSDRNIPHVLNTPTGRVTASLGVASVNPKDAPQSHMDLLQWTDEALYNAKKLGRNRVHKHTDIGSDDAHLATLSPDGRDDLRIP